MEVVKTIEKVRGLVKKVRKQDKTIGLVPTMGALHIGHISLIKAAAQRSDFVVVSIFVNPTQFGPSEDFDKYPRPFEQDSQICRDNGADVVFAPSSEDMYGQSSLTWVDVDKLTEPLCGRSRPGHFRGVTTVCAKLFNIVMPDLAFFGQKDAQQTIVIKRMVADLNMPLEIVVCPTVREKDGLAVSSRNKYLTEGERKDAPLIYEALKKGQTMIASGTKETRQILDEIRKILNRSKLIEPEYVEIVDAGTLQPAEAVESKLLIAIAAKLGSARLIDNITVDASKY
ncbi:MAG: pantoate--beta-alanine ligase [Phycisphaerales bacterium]|jgi:pantoate--beta-alanine ligase